MPWTLDDIPWHRFDPGKVDRKIVPIVKAASLVERNGDDYAAYLCNVFADDPEFCAAAQRWGTEEIQHGRALARWASLADPGWDFARASRRFTEGFRVDLAARQSVRGSRAGELVARCIVETGTSSYYTALGEAAAEPVLKAICAKIAADEFRHYKLFYDHLGGYAAREGMGRWTRLRIAAGRVLETDDDELAYAYYAANEDGACAYDRARCARLYAAGASAYYRPHHVARASAMFFKAAGLKPNGLLNRLANRALSWELARRASA